MLKFAQVQPGETVFDLGSGDGRVVIQAAKIGARGVGIEYNGGLVEQSKENADKAGVGHMVEIRHEDALQVKDLEKANVVCIYMLNKGMKLVEPMLKEKLKQGTRVISHNFEFKSWEATDSKHMNDKEGHRHWLYLYIV